MFDTNVAITSTNTPSIKKMSKPKSTYKMYPQHKVFNELTSVNENIDIILENEKQHNKTLSWNKLDKTIKLQKLAIFAQKYQQEQEQDLIHYELLIAFFADCLNKKKLLKKKDIIYDKDTYQIISIPSLHFNITSRTFSLLNLDKRVSTLKSLTPKRIDCNTVVEDTPYK